MLGAEDHTVVSDTGRIMPEQIVVLQGAAPLSLRRDDTSYEENGSPRSIPIEHALVAHTPISVKPALFSGLSKSLTGTSSGPAKERQHRPERVEPEKRTPEEIQIHIDRIEVTALPQIPPQPSARPTNKGVSLDEYLKRRDMRA